MDAIKIHKPQKIFLRGVIKDEVLHRKGSFKSENYFLVCIIIFMLSDAVRVGLKNGPDAQIHQNSKKHRRLILTLHVHLEHIRGGALERLCD